MDNIFETARNLFFDTVMKTNEMMNADPRIETRVEQCGNLVVVSFYYATDASFDFSPDKTFKSFIAATGFAMQEQSSIEDGNIIATLVVTVADDAVTPAALEQADSEAEAEASWKGDIFVARQALYLSARIYGDEVRLPTADPDRFRVKEGSGSEHLRNLAGLPIKAFTDTGVHKEDDTDNGDEDSALRPPFEFDESIPGSPW